MAKKTKKIDVKKVSKMELSKMIAEALSAAGLKVSSNSADYGFSDGTLVVSMEATDVQVKFITPKAGLTRYAIEEDEIPNLEG